MSNKSKNKYYVKAARLYEDGEIDKALKVCEEGISEDLSDAATLNLKGMLLYVKGDLQGAKTAWKINSDYNDDSMAKTYIQDCKDDNEKIDLFEKGQKYLKSMNIDQAIDVFTECLSSDFNAINVNLALVTCYIKKGDHSKAIAYVTKVLAIDKNNKEADRLAKELEKLSDEKIISKRKDRFIVPILSVIFIILVIVATIYVYKIVIIDQNNKANTNIEQQDSNLNEDSKQESKKESEEVTSKVKDTKTASSKSSSKTQINTDELQKAINEKDYDNVANIISGFNEKKSSDSEKNLVAQAKKLLLDEGTKYFYDTAMASYNKKEYENAVAEFSKGYEYGKGYYIYPHIVYFMAASNEALGNKDKAIKYYEEFYNNYKDQAYIDEAIYKLAVLYKDSDKEKSKQYASELKTNYSTSIYNNSTINSILS